MNIFKATSTELGTYFAEAVTSKASGAPGDLSIAFVSHPGGTFLAMDKKGRMSALTQAVTDAETALTQAPAHSRAALVFHEGVTTSALEWAKASDGLWRLVQK